MGRALQTAATTAAAPLGPTSALAMGQLAREAGRFFGLGRYRSSLPFDLENPKINPVPVTYNSLYTKGPRLTGFGKEPPQRRTFHFTQKIGDVVMPSSTGTANASITPYPLQPGLPNITGTYCSDIASYERYKFEGVGLIYKSTMEAGTKSYLGTIRLGFAHDCSFSVNTVAEVNRLSPLSGKPTEDLTYLVECDPSIQPTLALNGLKTRESAVASTADANDYDWGNLVVEAVAGADTTSATVGEVWIIGKVTVLGESRMPPCSGRLSTGWSDSTNASPLGLTRTTNIARGIASTITLSGTTITFPACTVGCVFEIVIVWWGGSVACTKPTVTANNTTILSDIGDPTPVAGAMGIGFVTTTSCSLLMLVRPNADNATIVLSGAVIPVTSSGYCYITALGFGLDSSEV